MKQKEKTRIVSSHANISNTPLTRGRHDLWKRVYWIVTNTETHRKTDRGIWQLYDWINPIGAIQWKYCLVFYVQLKQREQKEMRYQSKQGNYNHPLGLQYWLVAYFLIWPSAATDTLTSQQATQSPKVEVSSTWRDWLTINFPLSCPYALSGWILFGI